MEESFPMTGGDGPYSYAKNSDKQGRNAEMAKEILRGFIDENLETQKSGLTPFRIVDLGCSTGPNTFMAVDNIIEAVSQKYKAELGHSSTLPEFQVMFNDHASNDFNTLFANLPSDRKYFAAGVPGSFYGRLFPEASLNFVYSAFATHWLSKVPQEVNDPNSPICNKGRIYYGNAPDEVGEAYSAQYGKDMKSFLEARAVELAPGGLMALLVPGRPAGTLPSQVSLAPFFLPLESCLLDLVNEGRISKDKIDTFNLPIYSPSVEELKALIQQNGQFGIVRLGPLFSQIFTTTIPLFTVGECRAGSESLLTKHFGEEIIDELYERYANKIREHPFLTNVDGLVFSLFALLKRKH